MKEKIRHEQVAADRIRGEEIALMPRDTRVERGRSRRKVVAFHGRDPRELSTEHPLARAEFGDGGGCQTSGLTNDPALVAHQEIDHSQIPTAPDRLGIVRRKVVEEFGKDLAEHGIKRPGSFKPAE